MTRIGFTLFVILMQSHINYRFDKRRAYKDLDNPHLIS